jgi:hypothetical protein
LSASRFTLRFGSSVETCSVLTPTIGVEEDQKIAISSGVLLP